MDKGTSRVRHRVENHNCINVQLGELMRAVLAALQLPPEEVASISGGGMGTQIQMGDTTNGSTLRGLGLAKVRFPSFYRPVRCCNPT